MQYNKNSSIRSRFGSFRFAFAGVKQLFRQEPNARIHAVATVAVIVAGIAKGIGSYDWLWLIIAIAIVWITEAVNTCIEMLCDLYCDNKYHSMVKKIKDISAAAVLIASLCSVAIAAFIFLK